MEKLLRVETQYGDATEGPWPMGSHPGYHHGPSASDPSDSNPRGDKVSSRMELRAAQAYAEIVLRVEEDIGDVFGTDDDLHNAWVMIESSYGSRQSGIQAVINAELTLARWDGQTPITAFRDRTKALCTWLAAAGLTITPQQFYQYSINSLPAEYDMVIAVHNRTLSNYSVDDLCDAFRAIEPRKELRTPAAGSIRGSSWTACEAERLQGQRKGRYRSWKRVIWRQGKEGECYLLWVRKDGTL